MKTDFDLAIVGSGFSGSLLAMVARRIGLSVILVERGKHPRFAIGESTSPLANLIIGQLAARYDLPRLLPLTTYGEWQRNYPEVVCGLKRGFTYFKHEAHKPYRAVPDRSNQLLVAASPHDEVADTHWLRADVDHFLLNEAIELGVDYLDQTALQSIERPNNQVISLRGLRLDQSIELKARLVIDASGPRGFFSRALKIPEVNFNRYPATQTLFSHFTGVRRCDEMDDFRSDGDPPYAPDAAALHHVFDGGWMWVLRFNNGVTSAGVAVTEDLAREIGLADGEPAWRRFLERFPSIAEQFADAEQIREFSYSPHLSYRASIAAGNGFALLPSAAAFIDPLFSTGIPLTLLGIERLGRFFEEGLQDLRDYGKITLSEADNTAEFIATCYASFSNFDKFVAHSMFYFAAASFSEMARRLERAHLVRRFLAADHPQFGAAMRECSRKLLRLDARFFAQEVKTGVDCLNIAGLCDERKRNWYDIDLEDVVTGAEKLGFKPEEMRRILDKAPWAQIPNSVASVTSVFHKTL